MNKSHPQLSVVVPFFNSERFIRSSILSLLSEDLAVEIIAVDDGSQDQSVDQILDLPIRIIRLPRNQGQAAAQNRGIREANGEFLCFFDSDDVLVSGGLKARLEYLKQNPKCEAVLGRVAGLIDEVGNEIGDYYERFLAQASELPERIEWSRVMEGLQIPSQLWLYLFRTDFIRPLGALDEEYQCSHDNDYLHRVLKETVIHSITAPVAFYRLHGANQSRQLVNGQWKLSKRAQAEKLLVDLQYRK